MTIDRLARQERFRVLKAWHSRMNGGQVRRRGKIVKLDLRPEREVRAPDPVIDLFGVVTVSCLKDVRQVYSSPDGSAPPNFRIISSEPRKGNRNTDYVFVAAHAAAAVRRVVLGQPRAIPPVAHQLSEH